ncbi:MAG: sigma-70 family RNA polymerase sigma factor [Candidatus Ozemobacteraceae bacterium]
MREFETLVERHLLPLEKFFRYLNVPPSLIDDLIQETFVKVCDNLESFDLNRRFSPWLFAIGKNLFLDFQRKNQRNSLLKPDSAIGPDIADQIIGDQEVARILEILSTKDRFLLELRLFQGLTYAEIAEIADETPVSLRARFSRMMKKLREKNEV